MVLVEAHTHTHREREREGERERGREGERERDREGDSEDAGVIAFGDTHIKPILVQPLHFNVVNVALHAHQVLIGREHILLSCNRTRTHSIVMQ